MKKKIKNLLKKFILRVIEELFSYFFYCFSAGTEKSAIEPRRQLWNILFFFSSKMVILG